MPRRKTPAATTGAKAQPPAGVQPRQARPFTVTLFSSSAELGPQENRAVGLITQHDTATDPFGTVPGTVTLTVADLPAGVTGVFDPVEVEPNGGVSDLILSASGGVQPGTYHATVIGTLTLINTADGSQTQREDRATLDLTVRPFSLVLPASVGVPPGGSAKATVGLARATGFTGSVDLSLPATPAGIAGTFSPSSTTSNASSLTLKVAASVAPNRYFLNVVGRSGPVSRSGSLTLVVPSFALTIAPTSLVVVSGTAKTVGVTITRNPGFTGSVSLSLTSPNAGISGTFQPSSVKGSSSILTVNVAGSVPPGNYSLLVRAAQGGLVKSAVLGLVVRRFLLALSTPDVLLAPGGDPAAVTVSIARGAGFTGGVSLSLEGLPVGTQPGANIGFQFAPAAPTGAASTLTVRAGRFMVPGDILLTVRGTGGGQSETAALLAEVLDTGGP